MNKKKITLKEGDKLEFEGKRLVIIKTPQLSNLTFEVLVLGLSHNAENVQGEHKTDKPKGICKQTVCTILEKEIDRLKVVETDILMFNPQDDDKDGLFENDTTILPMHVNNAQAVMTVKNILNRINAL